MFDYLFDTSGFPPRWTCGEGWGEEPWLGWMHIVADVATWGAYTTIPIIIFMALRRSTTLPAPRVIWLFGLFILACGTTHLIEAMIFWTPVYRLSAVAKIVTAIVSWVTVLVLIPFIPKILAYRSPTDLEKDVTARTTELQEVAERLKLEVKLRTKATRSLRVSEERLRMALLAGRMGTWDWNLDTGDIVCDEAEMKIIGLQNDTGIFSSAEFFKLVHPEDLPRVEEATRRCIEEEVAYDQTFRIVAPDGQQRWIAGRGILVEEAGEPRRLVGVNYDVTSTKQTEMELADARKKAESASAAKSQFLANTSHEIRTPLTAILGCAESLVRQVQTGVPAETAQMIKNQGELLMRILNDVLDLSKIEAGRLEVHPEPCSPAAILNEIQSVMYPTAKEKGLSLNVALATPIPRSMQTDPLRIRQILFNLTSNAIKFTESGAIDVVAAIVYPKAGPPNLQIEVRDSGRGIPPEEIDSIFNPFHQIESNTAPKQQGTGLGLTISNRLATMLGGSLEVESQIGQGSVFRLTLPADANFQGKNAKDSVRPDELFVTKLEALRPEFTPDMKGRVLVAEDTLSVQFLIKRIFEPFHGELAFVEDGQAAIEEIVAARDAGSPFDLVLMDMQMPILTGYEATRQLREMDIDTPVIALTASAMAGDRERCLAAGCNAYLPKPIDWDAMVREVTHWLSAAPLGVKGHASTSVDAT